RLLEIRREAQDGAPARRLEILAREIDDLAGDIAKHALERPTEARTMSAAAIAIDAARSTVKRTIAAGEPPVEEPDLAGRMTSTSA
ncbi:C4-dicarboxylate ABC transporter substrate-binding protein, partial [Methylobacterium sp. WL122]